MGSPGGGGGGGLTSEDYSKAGIDFLSKYAQAALAKFGLGTRGTGKMAARGYAAAAAKASEFAFRQQLIQQKIGLAETQFAQTNPFEPGDLMLSIEDAPPKLAKAYAKATQKSLRLGQQAQTKKVVATERKVNARIARLTNQAAAYTNVRVGTLTGANQGYWREHGAPMPLWLQQGSH